MDIRRDTPVRIAEFVEIGSLIHSNYAGPDPVNDINGYLQGDFHGYRTPKRGQWQENPGFFITFAL
jgi:hypothetical protein